MTIIYPPSCISNRDKIEFCIYAEEKLRDLHNKMGRWYRVTLAAEKVATAQAWIDVEPGNTDAQAALADAQAYSAANPPITQAQYDASFPSGVFDKIKLRYPFAPALTKAQWDDFDKQWTIIHNKLSFDRNQAVEALRAVSEWEPDLEAIHGSL